MKSDAIEWYQKYHRLTNYLSAAMLYLQDNFFLDEDLKPEHIKNRILGHWGTVPGLNFIYGGLNYIVSTQKRNLMFLAGPGHGAPGVLSNLILEETLKEFYPDIKRDKYGLEKLIKSFSWVDGFPSHTYPGVPGTIAEGGELGYSLGTAFGAALDNPDLTVACVVGDGEAETGGLAASWHSNKFLNPKKDGTVLPILHLNGYRISGPTIMGTMSEEELKNLFKGYGYDPIYVSQYDSHEHIYRNFLWALSLAFDKIDKVKKTWTPYRKPQWPIIILRTKKGWTGPKFDHKRKIEDNNYSHGIPIEHPKNDTYERRLLEDWLKSYKVNELLTESKSLKEEILKYIPTGDLRMGMNRHTYGGEMRMNLNLPDIDAYEENILKRGSLPESNMEQLSSYIKDVMNSNNDSFRIFSPDESESNQLEEMYIASERQYIWPTRKWDDYISKEGQIMEILSETVLQEWMQGYILTGRHGILISYEAFLNIISSQIDQYIKYLKQAMEIKWRKPLASMNYIATSDLWRQEHNGFTHQNPSLINSLLVKQADFVSIYFPSDANTLYVTMDECLRRTNCVNLIVAPKRATPQWLSLREAKEHIKNGISIWEWASTIEKNSKIQNTNPKALGTSPLLKLKSNKMTSNKNSVPDVVLASAGAYQTIETLAAITILKKHLPEIKIQYVNVNEITKLGLGDEKNPTMSDSDLIKFFTKDRKIIFNFHGYPEAIKQLTWGHEISTRIKVLGYIEKGTTTTPFDMQVRNKTSRYHVAIEAIKAAAKYNYSVHKAQTDILNYLHKKLEEHKEYILQYNDDMPEIKEWTWE